MSASGIFQQLNLAWIYPGVPCEAINQYVEFRQICELDSVPVDAGLSICADSNYVVWINGLLVHCGQYANFPHRRIFDCLPVQQYLRIGKNVIAVLVYSHGRTNFSYLKGAPGLIYVLNAGQTAFVSGKDTLYRISPCYRQGQVPLVTQQLSYTFEYNAQGEDNWIQPDYIMNSTWQAIGNQDTITSPDKIQLAPRPIPRLNLKDRIPVKIIAQGLFKREFVSGKTVAEEIQSDYLSCRRWTDISKKQTASLMPNKDGIELCTDYLKTHEGIYLVVDLGMEDAGLLDLELETSAGVIIDMAYGEHLDDLRVRASVGGRNFANRYICRQGRQQFTHYCTRLAGRYLQLHIHNPATQFVLYYAGLRPHEYPIEIRGDYHSCDQLQNKIYEISLRTLHLCMHEHYEDCPWREQALYGNDSRNQMLAGYYGFGEYAFAAQSISLLGESQNPDGFLEMCAPSEIAITIPSFSLVWILSVADYLQHSGDMNLINKMLPIIERMIAGRITEIQDGLLACPEGKRYWQFYDWANRLTGDTQIHPTRAKPRFDAPLNLFFLLALQAFVALLRRTGQPTKQASYEIMIKSLRQTIHEQFWDPKAQAYITYIGNHDIPKHFAELTQSLALLAGVCPERLTGHLRTCLIDDSSQFVETTLSQSAYKFEALLMEKEKFGTWVFSKIAHDWGKMLYNGATSFWETLKGGDDFDFAGSLCHGWSAMPIYFYHAYLLGIRPLDPAFKTFIVDPIRTVVPMASGKVPTPLGLIHVDWEKCGQHIIYRLSHPKALTPKFVGFSEQDDVRVNYL